MRNRIQNEGPVLTQEEKTPILNDERPRALRLDTTPSPEQKLDTVSKPRVESCIGIESTEVLASGGIEGGTKSFLDPISGLAWWKLLGLAGLALLSFFALVKTKLFKILLYTTVLAAVGMGVGAVAAVALSALPLPFGIVIAKEAFAIGGAVLGGLFGLLAAFAKAPQNRWYE